MINFMMMQRTQHGPFKTMISINIDDTPFCFELLWNLYSFTAFVQTKSIQCQFEIVNLNNYPTTAALAVLFNTIYEIISHSIVLLSKQTSINIIKSCIW